MVLETSIHSTSRKAGLDSSTLDTAAASSQEAVMSRVRGTERGWGITLGREYERFHQ